MQELELHSRPVDQLGDFIEAPRLEQLRGIGCATRRSLGSHRIWHVNSTADGGGVAEMLNNVWPYACDLGLDVRRFVISGDGRFARTAKWLCDMAYGESIDDLVLTPEEVAHYTAVSEANAQALRRSLRPEDVVILHDPQTAGLIDFLRDGHNPIIWDCHVGHDSGNDQTRQAWSFLKPRVEDADLLLFTMPEHVPPVLAAHNVDSMAPAIDPASPKNVGIDDSVARSILIGTGILQETGGTGRTPSRTTGPGGIAIRSKATVLRSGPPPSADTPLVVQVARWDRLKDMAGVMRGFASQVVPRHDAALLLVGPDAGAIADDPSARRVFEETRQTWTDLSAGARDRIHLVSLPMTAPEENALIINAVQRNSDIVLQKSVLEAFGLTITEAMWKSRPVIASDLGGIRAQIANGTSGLLVSPDAEAEHFGAVVAGLLADRFRARRLGDCAHRVVQQKFLADRYLVRYLSQIAKLLI